MTCCRVHSVVDPAARVPRSPSMNLDAHARPWYTVGFTACTVLLAMALLGQLANIRLQHGDHRMGSIAFGILAVGLVASEVRPTNWTRAGERNGPTRGWAFAFALILLGEPILAITVMVAARSYSNLSRDESSHVIVYDSAEIIASLSMGSLVLAVFGVHGNIAEAATMSIGNSFGIVLAGLAIFVVNGLLSTTAIGLEQEAGILRSARAAFGRSTTADGALLVLAPVFAIGVESAVVALPLVGLAAWLAYRAIRAALQHRFGLAPDPLTGLCNHIAFGRRLDAALDALDREGAVVVLVMDLDQFRQVNDRFGHQVGDVVLVSFAERLTAVLPPTARVARLSGDEFAAFVQLDGPTGQRPFFVDQLDELLVERHTIDGVTLTTSASIGQAIAPADGSDGATLISSARTAMQRAKPHRTESEIGTPSNGIEARRRPDRRSDQPAAIASRCHRRPVAIGEV